MLRSTTTERPRTLDDLLGSALIARLSQLDVASHKVFSGKLKGERRSKRRGSSVEFADHRPYVVGDDLRRIDWNIFGRLDRMFLKLFLEEEDLTLHLVIDASASTDCGEPSKFLFIQRAAAALAYVGLINMHRVTITAIGERPLPPDDSGTPPLDTGGIVAALRNMRGRRRARDLGGFLCSLEPFGSARFADAAKRIALARQGKGVMVVLSDFFFKEGYEDGLRYLVGRGYDLIAVQVLAPQEVDPTIAGDLRLKDVEDGDRAEVTISAGLLKKYKANLSAYCDQLRGFCARRDITHMVVQSDLPADRLVLDYLRHKGVLK